MDPTYIRGGQALAKIQLRAVCVAQELTIVFTFLETMCKKKEEKNM